ncbi:MAG: cysteine desulfurase family protein [Clostridia bacterium]|nr:cysteine desulfurase family protein [Clostridia bacterium]
MIYFDNSATTQVLTEAAETAVAAMTRDFYNPAGAYSASVAVERQINSARKDFADSLLCAPGEIVFTSGGTESNNMAIFGTLKARRGKKRILTTAVEHPSVYEVFQAFKNDPETEIKILPVDNIGHVRLDALDDALSADTALVSVMHVNNELGTITDLEAVAALLRQRAPGAAFHSDGVQAYLKLPLQKLPVDLYSVSGHKFHAPKGVGFLKVRSGLKFFGGQIGGGQENNLRSGTTNVPAILAMQTAANIYRKNLEFWHRNMLLCKKRLFLNLNELEGVFLNGPDVDNGAPHILNLSFDGVRAEVLLHALEQKDVCVATGSACSSHKRGKNRVLSAIGVLGTRQEGALRFSFCPFNTLKEVDFVSQAIIELVTQLRKYRRR